MVWLVVDKIEVYYIECFIVWGNVKIVYYVRCVCGSVYLDGEYVGSVFCSCVEFFVVVVIEVDDCGG